MPQIIRFALSSALLFVLFACSQPSSQQPAVSDAQTDPNSSSVAPGQTSTPASSASITPSPMPALATGRRSGLETYTAIVILIAVLGFVLWAAFRRAGTMRGGYVIEAVVGFLGWFGINTLLWIWVLNNEQGIVFWNPFRLAPLCFNLPVLLVLGFTRRWTTLGILAAILVNAIGTLLFGRPGPYNDDRFVDIMAMIPFYLSLYFPAL